MPASQQGAGHWCGEGEEGQRSGTGTGVLQSSGHGAGDGRSQTGTAPDCALRPLGGGVKSGSHGNIKMR